MLDQLTIESFEPYVGSSFWLRNNSQKIELRLTRAARVMESEAARLHRTAFSLYFLGPVLLPQQIYRLTHDGFSQPLDLFLVPIAKEAGGLNPPAGFTLAPHAPHSYPPPV